MKLNRERLQLWMVSLRSFLLVKTQPGQEKQILGRFEMMTEVREIHLITGKFDLFVVLESSETELDPRREILELVIEKVRTLGGIVDTRTIIPSETRSNSATVPERPSTKGFVFIQCEPGKEKELMARLIALPDVRGVHRLFGKADLLAEVDVPKSFVHPPPQHISNVVETQISKLSGVRDTDTYVPLESIMKT